MKVLFLIPYPLGESPSQRFRFEQYFESMRAAGMQYRTQSFWDEQTWKILYTKGSVAQKIVGFVKGWLRRMYAVGVAAHYDRVFIHRECAPVGPPIIEWVLAKLLRKKIIYDFDDSIWIANTSAENKAASFVKWHSKVKAICRWSYTVSCGNDYLADYARQFNANVVVNPTTLDTVHLHNPALYPQTRTADGITIGWTGTHSTLKYLQPMVTVMQHLEEKYGSTISFLIIANKDPQLPLRSAHFVGWRKESEIADLLQMDIGIMPLTDDPWAKGKCGFKALQYMALGIPTVVSPVGVNTVIVDHGVNGLVADTEQEWEQALQKLLEDAVLRRRMGAKGRETVEARYSVTSNSSTFLSLFA